MSFKICNLLNHSRCIVRQYTKMRQHNHFVYIITNLNKTVPYTGVTSDLQRRLDDHERGFYSGFAKKYNCRYLIYFDRFQYIRDAIRREKQIKGWTRKKKEILISEFNPDWEFLNEKVKDW